MAKTCMTEREVKRRATVSKFGIGRSKLRDLMMSGQVPGVTKASW